MAWADIHPHRPLDFNTRPLTSRSLPAVTADVLALCEHERRSPASCGFSELGGATVVYTPNTWACAGCSTNMEKLSKP